jgi:zinc D-Ala-D-Ala dipeptidase
MVLRDRVLTTADETEIRRRVRLVHMKNVSILVLLASVILLSACAGKEQISRIGKNDEFVDVREFIPSVQLDIRYYRTDNFVGSRIDGYDAPKCFLTREAAVALKNVQEELVRNGQPSLPI